MSEQPTKLFFNPLNWQQQLAEAFTSIESLCAYLKLSPHALNISQNAHTKFPLRVPRSFADCMEKGNSTDPLLRQVLPVADEINIFSGYTNNPVGDIEAVVMPGLLHKYHGRVLLLSTGGCAINCRYCFRRNFPYEDFQLTKQQESNVISYIASNSSISEVILSGGDPLLLSDARLENLFKQIETIPHVKRIRIHSRLPIVLPARVTNTFIDLLVNSTKSVVMVVHCNHANEISEAVKYGFEQFKKKGVAVFNQSVLLKGVNDSVEILCQLSETLFEHGVIPYYLHCLDKATGTGHFAVDRNEIETLFIALQTKLPGYLVPKLVKEVAGFSAKQLQNF